METDTPPEPKTLEDVAALYPNPVTGSKVWATNEVYENIVQLKETRKQIKELEEIKKGNELAVKKCLGESEEIYDPNGR